MTLARSKTPGGYSRWRIFDEFATYPLYWAFHTRLETDVNLVGRTYTTAVIAPDVNNSNYEFDGTAFYGVFDGNEHKITVLTIDDAGAGNCFLGLFGCIEDGEVRNLCLEGNSVRGDFYIGGLVGTNYSGSIFNCYSTGSVIGTSTLLPPNLFSHAAGPLTTLGRPGGGFSNFSRQLLRDLNLSLIFIFHCY